MITIIFPVIVMTIRVEKVNMRKVMRKVMTRNIMRTRNTMRTRNIMRKVMIGDVSTS